MKTANMVLGVMLVVAALFAGSYSLFTTCSDNVATQVYFHLPSCSSLIAVGGVGLVTLIIGAAVLLAGREHGPAPPLPHPPPLEAVAPTSTGSTSELSLFCPTCGRHYPGSYKLCPNDGTPLKPAMLTSMACPKCGATVSGTDRFCPQCGFQGRA